MIAADRLLDLPYGAPAVVLVNPLARGAAALGGEYARLDLGRRFRTQIVVPESAQAMRDAVRGSARRGGELLVVAGGDGTLNQAVNAVSEGQPIALLPLGTANDFARGAGLPLELGAATARIDGGRLGVVDVISLNGRRLCSSGGLGLPASCVTTVDELRAGSPLTRGVAAVAGAHVYGLAALRHVVPRAASYEARIAWTALDGREHTWRTPTLGAFVANQPTIAGGMPLSPLSVRDDGAFELCVIRPAPVADLLQALLGMARGNAPPGRILLPIRAVRARVCLSRAAPYFADGELLGCASDIDIGIERRALTVVH